MKSVDTTGSHCVQDASSHVESAPAPVLTNPHRITDHGLVPTAMGSARRVQVEREDGAPMGWREVWEAFSAAYPGQWGVMLFPPEGRLLDQVNRYHLHVVGADVVRGMDLW